MRMTDTPSPTDELPESKAEHPESPLDSDRYSHLTLEDGAIVIYDRESPETWVQSDVAVEVGK